MNALYPIGVQSLICYDFKLWVTTMPMYNQPIEEIDESIKRPIVLSVVTDLLQLFGLKDNIPVVFKGQAPQPAYVNSDVDGKYLDGNNRFAADSLLTITDYDEEENETALLSTPIQYTDHKGVFGDTDINIHLVPAYISKRFNVSIQLSGTEKQIERWRANIKRRTAQGVLNGIHTVKYHYPIPMKFMMFLIQAHELRENVAAYNEVLGDWFRRCFIPTMDVIRSGDGSAPVFVIRETQQPIQGWFDFGTGAPKKEKEDDSRYTLNFTYTFYVDIPETMNLLAPLVIHNQLIPVEWIPKKAPMAELDFIKSHGSYSQEAFNAFRFAASDNEYTYSTRPGLPIPVFDDWIGDVPNRGYESIMRILTRLDESNLKNVMDLQGLGEWAINPLCVRYMKDTRAKLFLPYQNVINIMLYNGDNLLDMSKLSADENLFITYEKDLNLRKSYHVVVTMVTDPSMLSNDAWEDLMGHGCFMKTWISTLFPHAADYFGWDLAKCVVGGEGDSMTDDEFRTVIEWATNGEGLKRGWPLVGMFTVIAHRLNDPTS